MGGGSLIHDLNQEDEETTPILQVAHATAVVFPSVNDGYSDFYADDESSLLHSNSI